ncbi:cytochrome P450 CYP82D47-like [Magnolia sinica]|uniref:cytochrome P450 CYP82D47-like n=1 Tax=Magnolia sinica TaxID=86752 RepID=UPI00265B393B|nr:cytochrome P450 CYP82D47-like [Magnolia sinica]
MDLHFQLLAICCVLAALLFYKTYIARTSRLEGKSKKAPEPSGAWPLLGHLHLLHGRDPLIRTLGSMADKYGPAFILRLGMRRALFVSSWELAKECFTTNDLVLATRPRSMAGKYIGYDYAMVGFIPYGPYWRQIRKILTVELLSNRRLELLKNIRYSEIDMGVKGLHRKLEERGGGPVVVEMKRWFGDLTFNMLTMIVSGKRYFGSNGISDEVEARRFQHAMDQIAYLAGVFVVSDALPFLKWMDVWGHETAMKKVAEEMNSLISSWLHDHRLKRQSGKIDGGDRNFIDVMLSILEEEPLPDHDNDTVIKATSVALVIAGSETTAITLTWAISLLLNNRHVIKRAQDELDEQVGRDRLVVESDIKNLVYLQAIIKETMRLYPAAPLLLPHEAAKDCHVGGFHVPAGTQVFFNVWKIHQDPRVWLDPSEFRPERFITSHVDVDVRGQQFEYLPFGSGRRACPGITFAMQVMHLTLARLLHAFHLDTPNGQPVDMTEGLGLTIPKSTQLEVLWTPRLPSHLYK